MIDWEFIYIKLDKMEEYAMPFFKAIRFIITHWIATVCIANFLRPFYHIDSYWEDGWWKMCVFKMVRNDYHKLLVMWAAILIFIVPNNIIQKKWFSFNCWWIKHLETLKSFNVFVLCAFAKAMKPDIRCRCSSLGQLMTIVSVLLSLNSYIIQCSF